VARNRWIDWIRSNRTQLRCFCCPAAQLEACKAEGRSLTPKTAGNGTSSMPCDPHPENAPSIIGTDYCRAARGMGQQPGNLIVRAAAAAG
jgi:hypothetical protein